MPPKAKGKADAAASANNVIDKLFPPWSESAASDASIAEPYKDLDGLTFPRAASRWLDCWKAPGEVVLGNDAPQVVELESVNVHGQAKPGGESGRIFNGALFYGNPHFEWLMGVFLSVQQVQAQIPKGEYLFELIHPQSNGMPVQSASGKYSVKLWLVDGWRQVVVDDRVPVDLFGRPLCVSSRPLQLWPILLSKAIMKVMAAYQILACTVPDKVPAFTWLTSWPLENLTLDLNGINPGNGELFDRLEASVREDASSAKRHSLISAQLRERKQPESPPPRVMVFTGPPGIGKGKIMASLIRAHPHLFGRIVTHTTRPPKEHEVDGIDYHFVDKPTMRQMQDQNELLEIHKGFTVHGGEQLYGIAYSSIRTVASGGRICLVGLDVEGAKALHDDDRIDAMFVYVAPETIDSLEKRLRSRLREEQSTIDKRLKWAGEQVHVASDTKGLVDDFVDNRDDSKAVYWDIKEAIAKLSPIVRNRLHGIPSYILEYSDLVIANQVEKPFLKPVLVSGPCTTEKWEFLQTLADEFPDVFAFPKLYTDEPLHQPPDPYDSRAASDKIRMMSREVRPTPAVCSSMKQQRLRSTLPTLGPQLAQEINQEEPPIPPPSKFDVRAQAAPQHAHFLPNEELLPQAEADESDAPVSLPDWERPLPLEPVRLSAAEFDTMEDEFVAVEQHLFKHENRSFRVGVRMQELRDIMQQGKIPLLDMELDAAKQFRAHGTDCLSIFLQPPSVDKYHKRVVEYLTESDHAIAKYLAQARLQMRSMSAAGFYDEILTNVKLSQALEDIVDIAKKHRPDVFKDVSTGEDDPYAKEPWRAVRAIYLAGHPVLSNRNALKERLLEKFPDKFCNALQCTSRKPSKGEQDGVQFHFMKLAELEVLQKQGRTLTWRKEGNDVLCTTVVEAERLYDDKGTVSVIAIDDAEAIALVTRGLSRHEFLVHIAPSAADLETRRGRLPTGDAETKSKAIAACSEAADDLKVARVPQVVDDDIVFGFSDLRNKLAAYLKHHIKPTPVPLVVAGHFGSGKRKLLQRMLACYPDGFELPPVYTTNPDSADGAFKVVEHKFLDDLRAKGFLVYEELAMQHVFAVSVLDVQRIAAEGRVCLIEADTTSIVQQMQVNNLSACYIHLKPASDAALKELVAAQIAADPPLGHSSEDAEQTFYDAVSHELAEAAAHPELWDADLTLADSAEASYYRMMEAIADRFDDVVPPSHVWGFGRQLWDKSRRNHGQRPLNVMLLGPAGVGKTTVASELAQNFGMLHINVGDLLYKEVQAKSRLGRRAKRYLDASKLVPDDVFNQIVWDRLAAPDVQHVGYVLDGYPHTQKQVEFLNCQGIKPDKVIFLTGTHKVLLDRVKLRRVDYEDGCKPYRILEAGCDSATNISAAIKPMTALGEVDEAVMARLQVRHDDSEDNVRLRLRLWDKFNPETLMLKVSTRWQDDSIGPQAERDLTAASMQIRAMYKDVSITLPAQQGVADIVHNVSEFITLEDRLADSIKVMRSRDCEDLQYQVVDTLKFRGMPLVKLRQADGDTYWVALEDLAANLQCLNMHHAPAAYAHRTSFVRDDLVKPAAPALLLVDSPEPVSVLLHLAAAPQNDIDRAGKLPHKLLFVTGVAGVGKSTLIAMLKRCMPERLVFPAMVATGRLAWADRVDQIDMCKFERYKEQGFFVYSAESADGVRWGLLADEVEAKVRKVSGAFVLVEESPTGVLAARANGVQCLVVHVTVPDVDTLDQRLRRSSKLYEEQEVSTFLEAAAEDAAALAVAGVCDYTVANDDRQAALAALRAFLAEHWTVQPTAEDCQALVQPYDWRARGTRPTLRRLQHVATTATRLDLPRGRHLLRVLVDPAYVSAVTALSNDTCKLQDAVQLLRSEEKLHVSEASEALPALEAGSWRVLCRHSFNVAEPCSMSIALQCGPMVLQRQTRVYLLDNDTGQSTELLLGSQTLEQMMPNKAGYTVMAIAHAVEAVPASSYYLQVVSDKALRNFAPQPSSRCDHFAGTYEPNQRGRVWRLVLAPTHPVQLAVRAHLSQTGARGRLALEAASVDPGNKKGTAHTQGVGDETDLANIAVDAISVTPVVLVPAGRHILTFTLDRDACDFDVRPNGDIAVNGTGPRADVLCSDGEEPAIAPANKLTWELDVAPTADDKACAIMLDNSHQQAAQALLKSWIDQAAGGAKDRPKHGQEAMQRFMARMNAVLNNDSKPIMIKAAHPEDLHLRVDKVTCKDLGTACKDNLRREHTEKSSDAGQIALETAAPGDRVVATVKELDSQRAELMLGRHSAQLEARRQAIDRASELKRQRVQLLEMLQARIHPKHSLSSV